MTQHDLEHALGRARLSPGRHTLLDSEPRAALQGYDLSPAELHDILERDAEALLQLGADLDLAAWRGIADRAVAAGR